MAATRPRVSLGSPAEDGCPDHCSYLLKRFEDAKTTLDVHIEPVKEQQLLSLAALWVLCDPTSVLVQRVQLFLQVCQASNI